MTDHHDMTDEPELLATIETHHAVAQPMEVLRYPDGDIVVRAGTPYWTDADIISDNFDLWNVDGEEWGHAYNVAEWAGIEDPRESIGFEVACGDLPDLDRAITALDIVTRIADYLGEEEDWSGADVCDLVASLLLDGGFAHVDNDYLFRAGRAPRKEVS